MPCRRSTPRHSPGRKELRWDLNHSDRAHRFDHGHRHFEFPYWWYADYGYGYDYANYDSPAAYDGRYWQDLAMKVQSELARRGYYHGQINGVIDSSSSQAIRAFQKAAPDLNNAREDEVDRINFHTLR